MTPFSESFKQMRKQGKIPHLFLFHGSKESGKEEEALCASQILLQTDNTMHVDLHQYYPEGKLGMHSIHSIKNLCHEIFLSSHEGGYKCFIVHHAEKMLPSNANALLKTFEEPPEKNVIFLLTTKLSLILPTIRSRAQIYSFYHKQVREKAEERWLKILSCEVPCCEVEELCDQWDLDRKKEEAALVASLDKEMTALQKERAIKEIEGRLALLYQEKRENLFLTALYFYRDLSLYHLGLRKGLFFPDLMERYARLSPRDLDEVEKTMQKIRLAHDRGLKLSSSLAMLVS